jgi:hypothetical protein
VVADVLAETASSEANITVDVIVFIYIPSVVDKLLLMDRYLDQSKMSFYSDCWEP